MRGFIYHRILYDKLFEGSCHSKAVLRCTSGGAYMIRVELQIKRDGRIDLAGICIADEYKNEFV